MGNRLDKIAQQEIDHISGKTFDRPGFNDVHHPSHYTGHPSGIECIEVTKHFNFCLGNALKYIWRADLKGKDIEDLQKAMKYLQFEIDRRLEAAK